jgi:hypothetical protein
VTLQQIVPTMEHATRPLVGAIVLIFLSGQLVAPVQQTIMEKTATCVCHRKKNGKENGKEKEKSSSPSPSSLDFN